jgi:hypothetical protein
MEHPMTQESKIHGDLVERYIAAWNETNAERRRDLIAKTWTETATYVDPLMQGEGQRGIDAMVAAVQERFPGHRFALTGKVDGFADRVRFSWALAADGAPAFVKGTDFGVVSDGRLQSITGFIDQMPAPQQ